MRFPAGRQYVGCKAFDLAQEDPKLRERYGRHRWGQSALLARRLVEAGVTFVNINTAPDSILWDVHGGEAGNIEVMSDDVVTCTGVLTANGGASQSGDGGDANEIYVAGRFNTCSGTYTARGGDSVSGFGGHGGMIDVFGTERRTPASGSADVREGVGSEGDGEEGEVWVDGTKLPLVDGVTTLR